MNDRLFSRVKDERIIASALHEVEQLALNTHKSTSNRLSITGILPPDRVTAPYRDGMADGSDTTLTLDQPADGDLVSGLRAFAGDHGGAKAVIEYVGRRGARIVLVGEDGVWVYHFASGTDIARSACAEAGVEVENSWERELLSHMSPMREPRHSAERRVLVR